MKSKLFAYISSALLASTLLSACAGTFVKPDPAPGKFADRMMSKP
jgi:hypothetical protein